MINDKQNTIPKNWKKKLLSDVIFEMKDGGTPSKSNKKYFDGKIPWVNIKDIVPEIYKTKNTISEEGLKKSSAKLWPEESVILSFGATIGEVGIAKTKLTTKQGIAGIIPNKNIINKFLYYYLILQKKKLNQLATGSTIKEVRPNIIQKHLNILLPPINEQQKIAEILSTVDQEIEKTNEIIQKTEQLKKILVLRLISHNSAKTDKFKNLCEFKTGKLNSNMAKQTGKYPFFTCSQETFKINQYSFDQKAILLAGNNAAGKYSVKFYNGKFDAYQRTYVISIKDESRLNYIYLKEVIENMLEKLRKSSFGSTTKFLTLSLLENIDIKLPHIKKQKQISEILLSIDEKIDIYKKIKNNLTQLKKGLMQDLLSGKVRI